VPTRRGDDREEDLVPEPIRRTAARVLPVSPDGACLLLLERDPARPDQPWWGAAGGAVDPDEDLVTAAVRELREETGIVATAAELTPPIVRRVMEFSWNHVSYLGDATVFALALPERAPVSFEHLEPEEVGSVLEARWLTPEEAAADGRLVWPDLPELMGEAVAAVRARA
jgi:8-oxo-dGTP pyrophosphatase MutT (NUDIX family)